MDDSLRGSEDDVPEDGELEGVGLGDRVEDHAVVHDAARRGREERSLAQRVGAVDLVEVEDRRERDARAPYGGPGWRRVVVEVAVADGRDRAARPALGLERDVAVGRRGAGGADRDVRDLSRRRAGGDAAEEL